MTEILVIDKDKRDYLGLLSSLLTQMVSTHHLTEGNLELLVNMDGKSMGDSEKDRMISRLVPVSKKIVYSPVTSEGISKKVINSHKLLEVIADFQPCGEFHNAYHELLHILIGNPDDYRDVDIKYFNPEYVRLNLAFSFRDPREEGIPQRFDILEPCMNIDLPNMYFAALQRINGFPPASSDRASENIFNYMFLKGISHQKLQEELRKEHEEFGEKGPAGNIFVRLESEYLKKIMFYGNINPSETSEFDFFQRLAKGLKELQEDYPKMNSLQYSFNEGRRSYGASIGELFDDPVEFFSFLNPRNLSRLLYAADVKNYDNMLDVFLDDLPNYPLFLRLLSAYIPEEKDYFRMVNFIINSTDQIGKLDNDKKKMQLRRIQHLFFDNHPDIYAGIEDYKDRSGFLFDAISKHITPDKKLDLSNEFLSSAYKIAHVFEGDSLMLLEDILKGEPNRIGDIRNNIVSTFENQRFKRIFADYISSAKDRLGLFEFFTNFGSATSELSDLVSENKVSLSQVENSIKEIRSKGIVPTAELISKYIFSDKEGGMLLDEWKELLDRRFNGKFDTDNLLHVNLGYTQFSNLLNSSHLKEMRKDKSFALSWNFDSYLDLLKEKSLSQDDLGHRDFLYGKRFVDFEIDCAAYESSLFMAFIDEVKCRADMLERDLLVVPNLSNGYVSVVPLYDELLKKGIKVVMGAKVGSTEAHNNPSVFNKNLLLGLEEYVINESPIIIVADGTKHMVDKDGENLSARYPDAYQGYLNYVLAINAIKGFDISSGLKADEELKELRNTYSFAEFIAENRRKLKTPGEPYEFVFWNTAEIPMIIRKDRKKSGTPELFTPDRLYGPTMIFSNIGVLDDQIPGTIKEAYGENYHHTPAYFDDTGKIINLELQVSHEGIVFHNQLENRLVESYERYGSKNTGAECRLVRLHPNHLDIIKPEIENN